MSAGMSFGGTLAAERPMIKHPKHKVSEATFYAECEARFGMSAEAAKSLCDAWRSVGAPNFRMSEPEKGQWYVVVLEKGSSK